MSAFCIRRCCRLLYEHIFQFDSFLFAGFQGLSEIGQVFQYNDWNIYSVGLSTIDHKRYLQDMP